MPAFTDLKSEYENLWATMKVRPERAGVVDAIARKLIGHKAQYQAVEKATRVPWFVIAALHNRESDADFDTYLGNGEPLDRVTHLVPRGRGPFDSWEEGAIDALRVDGLDQVREWTPARACYEIEKFNGFGYRTHHKDVLSPYLWSFTNHYTAGKYVGDGHFDHDAVDKQCGALPVLKRITEIEHIKFDAATGNEPRSPSSSGLIATLLKALGALVKAFGSKSADKPVPPHPASVDPPAAEPPWMRWAIKEVGFHEIGQNRGIGKYTSLARCGEEGDPWCAIFVNAALEASGVRGTRSAMARSFEHDPNFVKLDGPAYGAVTTMWRGSRNSGLGHVFFYIGESDLGENDRGILALGGNQSDQVCRQYELRNRIVGYFWPKSHPLPKTQKTIVKDDAIAREDGRERPDAGHETGSET